MPREAVFPPAEARFACGAKPVKLHAVLHPLIRFGPKTQIAAPGSLPRPAEYERGNNVAQLKLGFSATESAIATRHPTHFKEGNNCRPRPRRGPPAPSPPAPTKNAGKRAFRAGGGR